MEGVGSRLGRASSRYGPTAATTVFNGPVRKWEKKWVHVSPSSQSTAVTPHHAAQSNGHNAAASPLSLRRWTPLPPAAEEVAGAEEPPRRKFRYTPIAVLEEQKKVAVKRPEDEVKTGGTSRSPARPAASVSDEADHNDNGDKNSKKETQGSNTTGLDLGLGLTSPEDNSNVDKTGETKEIQTEKASGFWSTGD